MVRVVCLLLLLPLVGCSDTAFLRPAAAAAASGGSAVRLWQDASIFGLVGALITSARHRVFVEVYELGRKDIVHSLAEAKGRGIDVRVITDPSVNPSRGSAARLDALHVPERAYPIDDARHQIDHVKLLIADGEAAVGGMNWGRHSDRNHDYVLDTRIPREVDRLVRIFEQDWNLAAGRPAPLAAVAGEVAQTSPGHEIRDMIEAALARAQRRVLVEMYTLTDPAVIADMAAARQRGVDVRVVLDPNQVYNRHAYALLKEAGVGVCWYPVPRGVLLHAKIGLVDGTLVLGSANWTLSGLGVNHELDIETDDLAAVSAYLARFGSDWSRSNA